MQPRVVFVKEKSTEPQKPINILRKMDATFFFDHQFWKKVHIFIFFIDLVHGMHLGKNKLYLIY